MKFALYRDTEDMLLRYRVACLDDGWCNFTITKWGAKHSARRHAKKCVWLVEEFEI